MSFRLSLCKPCCLGCPCVITEKTFDPVVDYANVNPIDVSDCKSTSEIRIWRVLLGVPGTFTQMAGVGLVDRITRQPLYLADTVYNFNRYDVVIELDTALACLINDMPMQMCSSTEVGAGITAITLEYGCYYPLTKTVQWPGEDERIANYAERDAAVMHYPGSDHSNGLVPDVYIWNCSAEWLQNDPSTTVKADYLRQTLDDYHVGWGGASGPFSRPSSFCHGGSTFPPTNTLCEHTNLVILPIGTTLECGNWNLNAYAPSADQITALSSWLATGGKTLVVAGLAEQELFSGNPVMGDVLNAVGPLVLDRLGTEAQVPKTRVPGAFTVDWVNGAHQLTQSLSGFGTVASCLKIDEGAATVLLKDGSDVIATIESFGAPDSYVVVGSWRMLVSLPSPWTTFVTRLAEFYA